MNNYIQAGIEGLIVPLFVVGMIIVSIIKSQKEQRDAKERMRKMGNQPKPKGPSPYMQANKPKPSSIEDFLKELAGESRPSQTQAPAQPAPRQPQKRAWEAKTEDVEDFLKRKRQEAMAQQEGEGGQNDGMKRAMAERRNREEARAQATREAEKKRKAERLQKKQKAAHLKKQKRKQALYEAAIAAAPEVKSKSHKRKRATIDGNAYENKSEEGTVYRPPSNGVFGIDEIRQMDKHTIRQAILMKEILGPPIGLRKRDAFYS